MCEVRDLLNQVKAKLSEARRDWHTLSAEAKAQWRLRGRGQHAEKQKAREADVEQDKALLASKMARMAVHFWGLGSLDSPLSVANFEHAARQALGISQARSNGNAVVALV